MKEKEEKLVQLNTNRALQIKKYEAELKKKESERDILREKAQKEELESLINRRKNELERFYNNRATMQEKFQKKLEKVLISQNMKLNRALKKDRDVELNRINSK